MSNKRLLTDEEIAEITHKRYKEITGDKGKPPIDFSLAHSLLKAQDAKSYAIGAREVIEWVDEHKAKEPAPITFDTLGVELCILIKAEDWQAYKKKKGVK